MIFSSNQKFEISGRFEDIKPVLIFLLDVANTYDNVSLTYDFTYGIRKFIYQITNKGDYCIGWYRPDKGDCPKGWKEYDFAFDAEIISKIIAQTMEAHIDKEFDPSNQWDGSSYKGFILTLIDPLVNEEKTGIVNASEGMGIAKFSPYWCFYHK